MEAIIITFAVILGMLFVILVTGALCRDYLKIRKTAFAAVLPVFPDDEELRRRLNYMEQKASGDNEFTELIVLVNYGATTEQIELCQRFCDKRKNVIFTDPASLEKILSKTFAIESKT